MGQIIINIINDFGYLGIALLIAVENIFPPIPSEVILTFGGFMTLYSDMNVWGVITAATIGAVGGAFALYYFGRILSVERLEQFFDGKWGKKLHLKREDVYKAEKWFNKYGAKTVFFCRFIPVLRSLISIPAGAANMAIGVFLPLTVTGTVIWNIVLVFLGRAAGEAWPKVAGYFNTYSTVVTIILLLFVVVAAIIFIKKRAKKGSDVS